MYSVLPYLYDIYILPHPSSLWMFFISVGHILCALGKYRGIAGCWYKWYCKQHCSHVVKLTKDIPCLFIKGETVSCENFGDNQSYNNDTALHFVEWLRTYAFRLRNNLTLFCIKETWHHGYQDLTSGLKVWGNPVAHYNVVRRNHSAMTHPSKTNWL